MIFKILLSLVLIINSIFAHSGGTNSDGCHNDYSNNTYHCHNGGSSSSGSDVSGAVVALAVVAIGSLIYYYFRNKSSSYLSSSTSNFTTNKTHGMQVQCKTFEQNNIEIFVTSVEALEFPKLLITFNSNEKKIFDTSLYLDKGIFVELQNRDYFQQVKAVNGAIEWPNGQDFCPDTLYIKGM